MIKRIFIDNYRCFVNFELQFDELTILLGANGSGKSSILDVIFAVRRLLSGVAKITDPDIFPPSTLTRWQKRSLQVVELDVEIEDESYRYRLEIDHDINQQLARVKSETLVTNEAPLFEFKMGEVHLYRNDHSIGPIFSAEWTESALARIPSRPDNSRLSQFLESMRKIVVCGLYPHGFSPESKKEDTLLERDGSNFASWYRHVVQERQDLISNYVNALREVIPRFRGTRLEQVGIDTRAFVLIFEHDTKRYELNLDEISDGQRALLALYALIHITAEQGYTLLFDEPDNYVALNEIQPWLISLFEASGTIIPQAVITSHHPEVIDYIGPERAVLLQLDPSGVVRPQRVEIQKENAGLKFSELVARGWEQ